MTLNATRIPAARLARMLNAAVSRACDAAHRATGNPCLPPRDVVISLTLLRQFRFLSREDYTAIGAFVADPVKHGHFARPIPLPFDMRPENRRSATEPERASA